MPAELVLGAAGWLPHLRGIKPAGGVRVVGSDNNGNRIASQVE